jgi:hypothetical protein
MKSAISIHILCNCAISIGSYSFWNNFLVLTEKSPIAYRSAFCQALRVVSLGL